MDDGLTIWQFKDLRSNVSGRDTMWTEEVLCISCKARIE